MRGMSSLRGSSKRWTMTHDALAVLLCFTVFLSLNGLLLAALYKKVYSMSTDALTKAAGDLTVAAKDATDAIAALKAAAGAGDPVAQAAIDDAVSKISAATDALKAATAPASV